MAGEMRVLILEDRKEDAKLVERELRAGGLSFELAVVETKDAYLKEIKDFHPHVILADYRLPAFDGMTALAIARERYPEVPFIFVSGTIGEDRAIEALKQGATDYVLKERLSRLVPVVRRALNEAETRTLKKQSEKNLRESEARFRATFEQAAVGIAQVSPEGRWLWMNSKICQIVGYSKEELLDRTYLDVTHPDDIESNLGIVSQVLAGKIDTCSFEKRYIRKDGAVVWANITTSLTRESNGQPRFFISVVEDITERKKAREALLVSERHYRSLFNNMLNGYAHCKMHFEGDRARDFSYLEVNGAFETLTGLKNVVGKKASEVIPGLGETDPWLLEAYSRVAMTGIPERFEYHVKALDMWFSIAVYSPQREHFVAIFDVITERKLAEELIRIRLSLQEFAALHTLEELLQKTLDEVGTLTGSPIGFYHFVEEDQVTLSLQAWSTSTIRDFCKADGKGLHYPIDRAGVWVDCVHERRPVTHNDYSVLPHRKGMPPGHAPVIRELVVPILRSERVVAILGIGNKPTLYSDKDIEIVSYLADVAWEIAERKQAEVALEESQEFKNAVLDSMTSHISVLDQNGAIVAVNEPWIRFAIDNGTMDGFPSCRTEVGINYLQVCRESRGESSEEAMAAHDGIRDVLDGNLPSFTLEYPCHSPGVQRWFMMSVTPLGQRERGVVISHTDITDRKKAEEERLRVEAQLRQAQKMEALGTLAGGIAHDFNNILGIIMGYTEMARLQAGEDDGAMQKELHQVLAAAHRAKDLVLQILAFSRRSEQANQPVQPALLAKEVLKMLRASLPSTIEIKSDVASRSVVMADPTQIHQVLMNLCTNAAHAMRESGGVLDVKLYDVQFMPEDPRPFGLNPVPHVCLLVKDSGHGIDPSIIDLIFDPFFTTKGKGEGTGLGLSVVHGIVKSYGGSIEVESTPGQGTSFRVFFPAQVEAAVARESKAVSLPHGTEKLLLVDDEPALGGVVKRMLERLGYEVDFRMDSTEALNVFRRQVHQKPFRLVITDMTMPQLTGIDLAGELLRIQPDLPVILCTGFSEKISKERARSLGIRAFLMKPVVMSELAEAVRSVLDGALQN